MQILGPCLKVLQKGQLIHQSVIQQASQLPELLHALLSHLIPAHAWGRSA